jgi:chaperonin GroEL
MTCEFENPYILFYDKKIRGADEIIPILTKVAKEKRPLLVIAEEIESQALSVLLVNRIQAQLPVCAIKAPAFGERRQKLLEDLALLTGGTLLTETLGTTLQQADLSHLGQAKKVTISKDSTIFVVEPEDMKPIEARIEEVKTELSLLSPDHTYDIQKSKERIAMLAGKVAVINVGAYTEIELKEKKFRIDDAIQATQAALKEGFVPGGGLMFALLSKQISKHNPGYIAIAKALQSPLETICINANASFGAVYNTISEDKGFDANNKEFCNLIERGIIDPTLVLTSAIDNAISVATTLLMTAATVTIDPEDKVGNETYIPQDPATMGM